MGGVKREWEETEARGWSSSDDFVNESCVSEGEFRDIIIAKSSSDYTCTFTGKSPAAPLDELISAYAQKFYEDFEDALDTPYNGREGGYLGHTFDSSEIPEESGLDIFENDALREAVLEAFPDNTWIAKRLIHKG